ncbi:hypothetical protein D3C77_809210 [compost metagenome]
MAQTFQRTALLTQAVRRIRLLAQFGEVRIDVLLEMFMQLLATQMMEILPAQQLAIRRIGE